MEQQLQNAYHECSHCHATLASDFAHCPHCGHAQHGDNSAAPPAKSKNTLLIVAIVAGVVLLALIGLGAYLWQQRSEQQASPAVFADSTDVPIDPSLLYEDKFQSYVSKEEYTIDLTSQLSDLEQLSDEKRTTTYTKEVDLEWPTSLKGVQHIERLQSRLMDVLFDKGYSSIDMAVSAFLKDVPEAEDVGMYNPSARLELKRENSPAQCVQFKVVNSGDIGGGTGASTYEIVSYVIYDKTRQIILTPFDIFEPGTTSAVIAQINREIKRINREKNEEYLPITDLPEDFALRSGGISFVARESVQYTYQGDYLEVTIPYTTLTPYFTAGFVQMLETPAN